MHSDPLTSHRRSRLLLDTVPGSGGPNNAREFEVNGAGQSIRGHQRARRGRVRASRTARLDLTDFSKSPGTEPLMVVLVLVVRPKRQKSTPFRRGIG